MKSRYGLNWIGQTRLDGYLGQISREDILRRGEGRRVEEGGRDDGEKGEGQVAG